MAIPSLLRAAEHRALGQLELTGSILDLGGDVRSEYRRILRGTHSFTTVNLDPKASPDILHDLEKPLPIADASFDHALLINVLEHVFEYRQLLREAARVVRPGGTVGIVVPFLFPLHPSPRDFWRFSEEALQRECELAGLSVERCEALGSGVLSAQATLLDRLLPFPLRAIGYVLRPFVSVGDALFREAAKRLGRKYRKEEYALGYLLVAEKKI